MSTTLTPASDHSALGELHAAVANLIQTLASLDDSFDYQQKQPQLVEVIHNSFDVTAHIKALHAKTAESIRQMKERMEKIRALTGIAIPQGTNTPSPVAHRSQGRSAATNKASAKKSSGTSGDSGDGDGDAPPRNTKKKNRPAKVRKPHLKYPPSLSTGAPQESLPSQTVSASGHTSVVFKIFFTFLAYLLVLVLMDERELALHIIESKWVIIFFGYLAKPRK